MRIELAVFILLDRSKSGEARARLFLSLVSNLGEAGKYFAGYWHAASVLEGQKSQDAHSTPTSFQTPWATTVAGIAVAFKERACAFRYNRIRKTAYVACRLVLFRSLSPLPDGPRTFLWRLVLISLSKGSLTHQLCEISKMYRPRSRYP